MSFESRAAMRHYKQPNPSTARLKRVRGVMIYEAKRGGKPLVLGINRLKRRIDADPRATRQDLIKARHGYYRQEQMSNG